MEEVIYKGFLVIALTPNLEVYKIIYMRFPQYV